MLFIIISVRRCDNDEELLRGIAPPRVVIYLFLSFLLSFSEPNQNLRCFSKMNFRSALLSARRDGTAHGICQELGIRVNLRDGIFLKTVLAMKFWNLCA